MPLGKHGGYQFRRIATAATMALVLGSTGCRQGDSVAADPVRPSTDLTSLDLWDVAYIGGAKVGHTHRTRAPIAENGRTLFENKSQTELALSRGGQTVELKMELTTVEDAQGNVLRLASQINLGPVPMIARGTVRDGELQLEQTTQGHSTRTTVPWPQGTGAYYGLEDSLAGKPMKPGETRRLKNFLPVFNRVADVTLSAKDFETTKMLGGATLRLLRVDSTTVLPGQAPIAAVVWVDESGQCLKTHEPAMGQDTFRTTRQLALEKDGPPPDVFELSVIKPRPAPNRPHDAEKIVYRVTLKNAEPAERFPSATYQSVKSLGPQRAEITVHAARPGDGQQRQQRAEPTDADRRPNGLIQSDDAEVVKLAREAAPRETDPWKIAVALEKHIRREMKHADFSQALSSAAEVARSRRGDCTEHAVLLAAVARARGIPARVAIGLVYAPALRGFGYHMWTEVWIDGRWYPLDATLGRGGIGGGHLKLADTNFADTGFDALLPVYQMIGQLAIETVE